eukprot:11038962-Heterocapsa_arctica.AAC.1
MACVTRRAYPRRMWSVRGRRTWAAAGGAQAFACEGTRADVFGVIRRRRDGGTSGEAECPVPICCVQRAQKGASVLTEVLRST